MYTPWEVSRAASEHAGVCFHEAFLPIQPAATTESAFKIKPRVQRGAWVKKRGNPVRQPEARVINHTASEYN